MQETYFVWSFVSEIYMVKKREMKSLIIFYPVSMDRLLLEKQVC